MTCCAYCNILRCTFVCMLAFAHAPFQCIPEHFFCAVFPRISSRGLSMFSMCLKYVFNFRVQPTCLTSVKLRVHSTCSTYALTASTSFFTAHCILICALSTQTFSPQIASTNFCPNQIRTELPNFTRKFVVTLPHNFAR